MAAIRNWSPACTHAQHTCVDIVELGYLTAVSLLWTLAQCLLRHIELVVPCVLKL
jgi:hypothetical protein